MSEAQKVIREIYITPPFDESVGIREATYTISDVYYDSLEPGEIEEFRGKLAEAFAVVDDVPVKVVFDFELPKDPEEGERPEEGDCCPVRDCGGKLHYPLPDNCSCHISPPCSACTGVLLTCDKCGWLDVGF